MNIKKNKGLEILAEMEEQDADTFNSFLADLDNENEDRVIASANMMADVPRTRTTTDSEILSMMLMELKKISTALAAGVNGSMAKKGNNFKQGSDGAEEFTVKAKIAEVEDKGKFLRVKIASKPVIWASCWDESIAQELVDANEHEVTVTLKLKKKGDYTNVISVT